MSKIGRLLGKLPDSLHRTRRSDDPGHAPTTQASRLDAYLDAHQLPRRQLAIDVNYRRTLRFSPGSTLGRIEAGLRRYGDRNVLLLPEDLVLARDDARRGAPPYHLGRSREQMPADDHVVRRIVASAPPKPPKPPKPLEPLEPPSSADAPPRVEQPRLDALPGLEPARLVPNPVTADANSRHSSAPSTVPTIAERRRRRRPGDTEFPQLGKLRMPPRFGEATNAARAHDPAADVSSMSPDEQADPFGQRSPTHFLPELDLPTPEFDMDALLGLLVSRSEGPAAVSSEANEGSAPRSSRGA